MAVIDQRQVGRRAGHQKRADLQGMRAVAVLTVVANHLFDFPPGGFVGVDVFFVLSGFFITGILIRERTETRGFSFQQFYIRRVKRILPSALLVLMVTIIGAYALFPAARAKGTLVDALYAAVFAANYRFQALGADYFQRDLPPSPVLHYWSLSIEEQFYFVWPFLLVAIFAITRRHMVRGNPRVRQWGLFGAMSLVIAASLAWAMYLTATDPAAAYYSTFTRVWELGIGALLAIAGPWLTRIPSALRTWLAYVGLTGVLGSLFLITESVHFPAPWAALPVLSTALVIASFHGAEVRGMAPLTNPVARYFGDTSYTLYLWHWPVIVLLLAVLPRGPLFYIVALSLAFGLTAITYHFYEKPIRESDWLEDHPTKERRFRLPLSAWGLMGCAVAAAVVLSILSIQYTEKTTRAERFDEALITIAPAPTGPPPVNVSRVVTPPATPLPGADPCFGAPAMWNANCALRNPDSPLKPSLEDFATNDGGTPVCWTEKEQPLNSCTYGYEGPDATRIALVGDSHGSRVLVALAPYLEAYKWRLTTYLGWGCVWRSPLDSHCTATMEDIQRELLERKYDLVLTTASRDASSPDGYVKAWKPVADNGSRVAVLADNPAVSEEAIACLTRVSFGSDKTGDCGTSRADALAQRDPLIFAASRVPTATLIDLTPYYCTEVRCPSVIGNVIVYSDVGGHLTATYIRSLAPAIVEGVRQALSVPAAR
jgi:peptidoglycan/LPS O-acetylase OafA/YrhL